MLTELVLVSLSLVVGIIICVLMLYAHVTQDFRRWVVAGVPHITPAFPYGSHSELLTQSKHVNQIAREDYERFKGEPVYGWHMYGKPVLGIINLEIVKRILTTDFSFFMDRLSGGLIGSGGNLDKHWLKQLTNLRGEEWRDARHTFSPVFTPSKVKVMMQFIRQIGERLSAAVAVSATLREDIELKPLFEKFTLDSLACCAFGVDTDSFRTKDSRFMEYARQLFVRTRLDKLFFILRITPVTSTILYYLKINTFKPKETKFFRDVVVSTIQQRRETGERKNDLIDLMIDCLDREHIGQNGVQNGGHNREADARQRKIDEDTIVSTAMVLLVAGFDTTSNTLSYMIYQLSKHPQVQTRLQEEIDAACKEANGDFPDYETVQGLTYLDSVIHETIRLHSPAGLLVRICAADYVVPGTDILLKEGDLVSIPVSGIHADSDYYPNPADFNPENFSAEAKANRSSFTFLGFSEGPRVCIGRRFALLEIKVAMIFLLRRFTFLYSNRNPEKLTINPNSHMAYDKAGLWARAVERRPL